MLSILFFILFSSAQNEAKSDDIDSAAPAGNEFYDPVFINGIVLTCFDKSDFGKNINDLKRFRMNGLLLSDALSKAFIAEDMTAEDSIAYLAHSLHETRKLLDFVQVTNKKYCNIDIDSMSDGGSLNERRYCAAINKCNRAAASVANEDKIGFGGIHTTGCDTFASTIGYFNSAEWEKFWEIPDVPIQHTSHKRKDECARQKAQGIYTKTCYEFKTLGRTCTDDDIRTFKKYYKSERKREGHEAYFLELFDDRNLIASPCMSYNIKGVGKVKGSVMLARASVGFFMQKCKGLSGSARTRCVNGGSNGAEERSEFYTKFKSCYSAVRKKYHR